MIAESEHSVQMEADVADTSVTYSDRAYFLLDLKLPDLKTGHKKKYGLPPQKLGVN